MVTIIKESVAFCLSSECEYSLLIYVKDVFEINFLSSFYKEGSLIKFQEKVKHIDEVSYE